LPVQSTSVSTQQYSEHVKTKHKTLVTCTKYVSSQPSRIHSTLQNDKTNPWCCQVSYKYPQVTFTLTCLQRISKCQNFKLKTVMYWTTWGKIQLLLLYTNDIMLRLVQNHRTVCGDTQSKMMWTWTKKQNGESKKVKIKEHNTLI